MEGIHQIVIPSPFAIGPVNVYLLTGEPLTLVDVGPNTQEALAALNAGLNRLGYELSDLEQIVITHVHHDHFGLAGKLLKMCQAEVIAHPTAEPWLTDHEQTWQKTIDYFSYLYRQAGLSEKMIEELAKNAEEMFVMAESVPIRLKTIGHGEKFKAGGDYWQLLYTPGHSRTCICLYQEEKGIYISGDHLLLKISSNPLLEPPEGEQKTRVASLPTYLEAHREMAELPIQLVLPGHGQKFTDHREVIKKRFVQYEDRQKNVYQMVNNIPQTAYQICLEMFPQIGQDDLFLGLSEAFNHLDILVQQGMIRKTEDGLRELFYK